MAGAIDAIDIAKVTKRYGRHRALAGVDVRLERGSLCALLGPNGAGKSTLLGVVSTLVRPTAGQVSYRMGERTVDGGAELRRHIGVLAHESFVYAQLTAVENLQFWARLYGVMDGSARISALLDEVGLDERARGRAAGTYSRGMTQRLALARALLHDPSVLLLDEPFTGLDRRGTAALQKTLRNTAHAGRILLVVTHDLEAIADVTDHVVVLARGKVQFEDRRSGGRGFSYSELQDIYLRHSD